MPYILLVWSDDLGMWMAHSVYSTFGKAFGVGFNLGLFDNEWKVIR